MKLKAALLGIMIMAMVFVTFDKAQAFEAEGSVGADILSNYVWRGQNLVNDSGVIQPGLEVAMKNGVAFGYWANYNLNNNQNSETDLTISYSRDYGKLSTTSGYIHYAFDGAEDTAELFLALGYDMILSPSLTIYHDIDEGHGQFIVFAIGHTFKVGNYFGRDIDLNLGASAGYNMESSYSMGQNAKAKDFSDFYSGELSASLTIPLTKNITIEPKIAYTGELSDEGDEAITAINIGAGTGKDTEVVYGGVNVSMAF